MNQTGQLGVGHQQQHHQQTTTDPRPLRALTWKALSIGGSHGAGVGERGEVYTWGLNNKGQLGFPCPAPTPESTTTTTTVNTISSHAITAAPKRMDLLYGWDVKAVACGVEHTVAVTPHDVITWGSNDRGQCGHGEKSETDWVKPRSLKVLHEAMVAQVECGRNHTLCVTGTSQVYAWGANDRGQLGLGDSNDRRSPCMIEALWALPVLQLAAGASHSAALTSNGFLFTWGANEKGQLGLPAAADVAQQRLANQSASEQNRVNRRVNQRFLTAMMEMGIPTEQAELALHETGNVGVEVAAEWLFSVPQDVLEAAISGEPGTPIEDDCIISDNTGQTSHNSSRVLAPKRVPLQGVRYVAAGWFHTVAVTDEEVYAWGCNAAGQLGNRTLRPASLPTEVVDLQGHGVCQVACGPTHTLFLCRDGLVYGCGSNEHGELPGAQPDAEQDDVHASLASLSLQETTTRIGSGGGGDDDTQIIALNQEHSTVENNSTSTTNNNNNNKLRAVTTPTLLHLSFLENQPAGAKVPVVSLVVAADHSSAFITRGADELPEPPAPHLWERLQDAVMTAREAPNIDAAAHMIPPIASAVERVFGSPAAISAAFGMCDTVGIDVQGLEAMQKAILELEPPLSSRASYAAAAAAAAVANTSSSTSTTAAGAGGGGMHTSGSASSTSSSLAGATSGTGINKNNISGTASATASPDRNSDTATALSQQPLYQAFKKAMDTLILEMERNIRLLGTPERAQVLLAAMQSHLLGDLRGANNLVPRVCNAVLAAPSSCRHLLVKWWAEYPPDLLEQRVVRPLQKYLTDELYATKKLTVSVMNVIKVLAKVEEANQLGRKLPPDCFYNELISEKLDVLDHYVAWRQTHDMPQHNAGSDGPFSFCSYPFLLNPRAKSKLLHTEARIQMDQTVAASRLEQANSTGSSRSSRRNSSGDSECVIPSDKPRPLSGGNNNQPNSARGMDSGRRRDRQGGGLRWLFSSLRSDGNNSTTAAAAAGANIPPPPPSAPGPDSGTGAAGTLSLPEGMSPTAAATAAGLTSHEDERRMVGRQAVLSDIVQPCLPAWVTEGATRATGTVSIVRNISGSSGDEAISAANNGNGASRLWKQGSLNLPTPEESGFPAVHPDMCIVRIRRNHLLEDGLNEIARQKPRDLFKPLRVHFIGEDGIDAGGVKKEFFQLLLPELLNPDYGMLIFQSESRTYWFNPASLEAENDFMLLGLVLGLAIYNGVLLDFPLPLALYRKVLGQEVKLRDLEDMQPTLGRSLKQMLQYGDDGEGSVEDVFCQSFIVQVPAFGTHTSFELIQGGEDIPVTEENRREFVDLYVDFFLNRSVHAQFEAFAKGFLMLCGGPALQLFSATELERLVCGNPCLDFDGLIKGSRYEGGYHAEHRVVQWLWQVVNEFDAEDKKLFLKFFTGSDRAPIGGLGNLRCIIQRDGPDSSKLPTSHTCFNTLLLPSYRSREKLADRLKLAISNSEGFGLE